MFLAKEYNLKKNSALHILTNIQMKNTQGKKSEMAAAAHSFVWVRLIYTMLGLYFLGGHGGSLCDGFDEIQFQTLPHSWCVNGKVLDGVPTH